MQTQMIRSKYTTITVERDVQTRFARTAKAYNMSQSALLGDLLVKLYSQVEDPMKQKERLMKPVWDELKKLKLKSGKKIKPIDVDEVLAEALAEDYDRIRSYS